MTHERYGRATGEKTDFRPLIIEWRQLNPTAPITTFLTWCAHNLNENPFDVLDDDEFDTLLGIAGVDPSAARGVLEGWGVWP